jgi:hypothetical protein
LIGTLITTAGEFMRRATDELRTDPWAESLLSRVNKFQWPTCGEYASSIGGAVCVCTALCGCGCRLWTSVDVRKSRTDFHVHGPVEWLIEIVNIHASHIAKRQCPRLVRSTNRCSRLLKAVRFVQERIHVLTVMRERDDREGEIQEIGCYSPNLYLLAGKARTEHARAPSPLMPK